MNISVFEVTGPVMIGPSSSHTAGAARLAQVAALIISAPFRHVSFGLHGSFAKTYHGHGTDKALVAGIMGIRADDERLAHSFSIAAERGITFDFHEMELDGMHDNSVCMDFTLTDGKKRQIIGSSIGGGQIVIRRIDGLEVDLTAQSPTLIIHQVDTKGVVCNIAQVLADNNINIGIMKLSRVAKGQLAICVIETDNPLTQAVADSVAAQDNVISVQVLNPDL